MIATLFRARTLQQKWPIRAAVALLALGACAPSATHADPLQDKPVSGPPEGMVATISFVEDFEAVMLDTSRWQTSYANPEDRAPTMAKRNLWGNRERQVYFDREYLGLGIDPFRIADGVLTIEARPLDSKVREQLAAHLAGLPGNLAQTSLSNVAYSSGMISSRGRFAQRFGFFEIRARWSGGKGLWPAFWLLPESGRWPPEIDVLEAHGDKPDITFHSFHPMRGKSTTERVLVANADGEFHNYGALWLPGRIDYFVDGKKLASIALPEEITEPMFVIANLAVGGAWPGDPNAATQFPAKLEIDHIRVWSLTALPE